MDKKTVFFSFGFHGTSADNSLTTQGMVAVAITSLFKTFICFISESCFGRFQFPHIFKKEIFKCFALIGVLKKILIHRFTHSERFLCLYQYTQRY